MNLYSDAVAWEWIRSLTKNCTCWLSMSRYGVRSMLCIHNHNQWFHDFFCRAMGKFDLKRSFLANLPTDLKLLYVHSFLHFMTEGIDCAILLCKHFSRCQNIDLPIKKHNDLQLISHSSTCNNSVWLKLNLLYGTFTDLNLLYITTHLRGHRRASSCSLCNTLNWTRPLTALV